jgi:hypothetical protein
MSIQCNQERMRDSSQLGRIHGRGGYGAHISHSRRWSILDRQDWCDRCCTDLTVDATPIRVYAERLGYSGLVLLDALRCGLSNPDKWLQLVEPRAVVYLAGQAEYCIFLRRLDKRSNGLLLKSLPPVRAISA